MLSDERYKKFNYLSIVNSLKKTDSSKYNPTRYFKNAFFVDKKRYLNKNFEIKDYNKILILGPGKSVYKKKNKIENFIKTNNVYVIVLNTTSNINEKLVHLRAACHPLRIISDIPLYKKLKTPILLPYSSFKSSVKKLIKRNKVNYIDYGLKLNVDNKIFVNKNYCILPSPLAIGYVLSIVSKIKEKRLFLAGFDGFDLSNPESDDSEPIISFFINNFLKLKPFILTPSKYKKLFLRFKL